MGYLILAAICTYVAGYVCEKQYRKWYGFPNFLILFFIIVGLLVKGLVEIVK